jgi:hypothetical protein
MVPVASKPLVSVKVWPAETVLAATELETAEAKVAGAMAEANVAAFVTVLNQAEAWAVAAVPE